MKHHRFTNSTGILNLRDSDSGGLYKSYLEKCAFIAKVIDPKVKRVGLQEPTITYIGEDGRRHRYTADLQVERRDATRLLVLEVKYERELRRKPELKQKFELIQREFDTRGIEFHVVTETDIHSQGFAMKRFVFDYRNLAPHSDEAKIMMVLRRHESLTLEQVLQSVCGMNMITQVRLAPYVWRLVATHQILVDFEKNLDLTANLRAAPAIQN